DGEDLAVATEGDAGDLRPLETKPAAYLGLRTLELPELRLDRRDTVVALKRRDGQQPAVATQREGQARRLRVERHRRPFHGRLLPEVPPANRSPLDDCQAAPVSRERHTLRGAFGDDLPRGPVVQVTDLHGFGRLLAMGEEAPVGREREEGAAVVAREQ